MIGAGALVSTQITVEVIIEPSDDCFYGLALDAVPSKSAVYMCTPFDVSGDVVVLRELRE